jgi:hypothetical protein
MWACGRTRGQVGILARRRASVRAGRRAGGRGDRGNRGNRIRAEKNAGGFSDTTRFVTKSGQSNFKDELQQHIILPPKEGNTTAHFLIDKCC